MVGSGGIVDHQFERYFYLAVGGYVCHSSRDFQSKWWFLFLLTMGIDIS